MPLVRDTCRAVWRSNPIPVTEVAQRMVERDVGAVHVLDYRGG
jgi:hypothetical protein